MQKHLLHSLRTLTLGCAAVSGLLGFNAQAQDASDDELTFAIELTELTPVDFKFNITPSDEEAAFYYYVMPKKKFDTEQAADGIIAYDVAWWAYLGQIYSENLSDVIAANLYTGSKQLDYATEYGKSAFWNSDYVIYCYGLDTDGDPTSELFTLDVHTPSPELGDLTFNVSVSEITPVEGSSFYVDAKILVDPSDDDATYVCRASQQSTVEWYQEDGNSLTPDEPLTDYIVSEIVSYSSLYSGYALFNCERLRKGRDYYFAVIGYGENGPTTELTLLPFNATATSGVDNVATENVVNVYSEAGEILFDGQFDSAAIYSLDGRLVKMLNKGLSTAVAPGLYLVKTVANGNVTTTKVVVR
jgi:hypothetical protein